MANIIPATAAGFPQSAFIDPATGDIATVWRYFLLSLYTRTGSGVGVSSEVVQAALSTEVSTRAAAIAQLAATVAANVAAFTALVATETNRAEAAEALLAPLISPFFVGIPRGPTAAQNVATTQLATTAFARIGTRLADSAAAGQVGEYTSAVLPQASAVNLTTATPATVISIPLAPGDWEVWGTLTLQGAASTVVTQIYGAVNNAAVFPAAATVGGYFGQPIASLIGPVFTMPTGRARISLPAAGRAYLMAQATFTTAAMLAYGFIAARRPR